MLTVQTMLQLGACPSERSAMLDSVIKAPLQLKIACHCLFSHTHRTYEPFWVVYYTMFTPHVLIRRSLALLQVSRSL